MTNPDLSLFRHVYPCRARSFQVDRQNVVHNIWYFFMLEEARVEYMRMLGVAIDDRTFVSHSRFYVVRNTCDYFAPAFFDEELLIHTRISQVGNSAVHFEHAIMNASNGALCAKATQVLVYIDIPTNRPDRLPDAFRQKIAALEGPNVVWKND
jgi:acyl-CoA thioester hydrolase